MNIYCFIHIPPRNSFDSVLIALSLTHFHFLMHNIKSLLSFSKHCINWRSHYFCTFLCSWKFTKTPSNCLCKLFIFFLCIFNYDILLICWRSLCYKGFVGFQRNKGYGNSDTWPRRFIALVTDTWYLSCNCMWRETAVIGAGVLRRWLI